MNATPDGTLDDPATEPCVGCGALVPRIEGPVHPYMLSAPGCWAAFGVIVARTQSEPTTSEVRQYCADAFAVQHPGTDNRRAVQSVGGHLVSLYAMIELGADARRSAVLLQGVLNRRQAFHRLVPTPSFAAVPTAIDMDLTGDLARDARAWAAGAWAAWEAHHAQVRAWYDALLRDK